MHGKTHAAWGAACGAAVAAAMINPTWAGQAVAMGAIGGLVPDWLQINVPGASKQIKGAFGHRGFSHWVWGPLFLMYWASQQYVVQGLNFALFLAFCAGWVSHILLDAFSSGVPAFWPFGRLSLAKVKTGGKGDKFIGGAGLVMGGLALLSML